ncbi:DUF6701 domain-containing protein [Aeromonas caviae]|mgnify:FL=1|uniref:DUF6701 domain-containing protein n=1 Tax=Aeromonas TaxID=642 RepID=UPI000DEBA6B2|nr:MULTISPECIES: DUF6701 domain-containing protein [Aeromonas]MBA8780882.1 hypothetical protein [Aeromonas caviae]MBA8784937.1 hypothetical protein [Aeromonas sp. TW 6]MBL0530617.1 hypothetical protein [Aeromonas caviae]MCU7794534.1 hypothetical protein [Aeromonas caviae]MCY9810101.1 hypothetical protein [Aeromonas caviae]
MSGAFDAINTSTYFPAVVQGHHGVEAAACTNVPNPQLSEVNQPKINGTGGNKLAFCSISANQNNTKNCDDGQGGYKVCAVTGRDIAGLSLTGNNAFPTNGSTTDLACTNNGSAALSQKDYRTVTSSGCQLTMTAQPGYQVKSLTMSNGGTLTLGPGDHFFETLSLDSTTIKLQSVDQALTRIFVKNTPTLQNNFSLNAGGKQNLIWVSYGDFAMQSGSFVGYLYAGGKVTLSNQATLTGRITSRALEVRDNSVINKGDAVLPSSTCKNIFTDPPSGGVIMTPPPGILEPPLGDLSCEEKKGVTTCTGAPNNSNVFAPGDHDFNRGSFGNDAALVTTGVTARLYFNELTLNNAQLNVGGAPENLLIYVKGLLNVVGQVRINGILYVAGDVKMTGNSELRGAVAAGGSVDLGGSNNFQFVQDAVDKVDFGDITCGGGSGGSQLDHFELSHSGQALTCNPETVVIKACANAGCSQLVTEQVSATLSLSPSSGSNGWVGGNQVVFSGGSTSAQLRNNTASAVTIGVSSSTPGFLHGTLCRAGSGALSAAACTLSFADSGFIFDVLDTLANRPQQVQLKAVRKDNVTQQCVPSFANVSKAVSFWSDYVSPATNTFGSRVMVNGSAIATAQGAATLSNLSFDAKGEATLTVSYPDAGQMRLNARHDGSGDTAGLVMTGSDLFVSRPVGLCITPAQGACTAGDVSCPVFKKAGDDFQLNIGAVAWQADNDSDFCSGNLATPNFTLAKIALGSQLVAPKPGVEAVVSKLSYDHAITASNNLNAVTQSLNEVGVFQMTATPPTSGYFGSTIPAATSVPVGRFVPWDYSLSGGFITPACNIFTYMSQPFQSGFIIKARNNQGVTTQNYKEGFAKGIAQMVAANALDGVDRSTRFSMSPSLSWIDGVATVDQRDNTRFDRGAAPEEPLSLLDIGLRMDDKDGGETVLTGADMNPGVAGGCQGVGCNAIRLGTQELRYGRVLASTRQGVASAPLMLPLQVQYFEGAAWKINQADVCTQLSLAKGGFVPLDPTHKISLNNGSYEVTGQVPGTMPPQSFSSTLTLSGLAAPASVATANKGEILFHFSALVPVPNKVVGIPYKVELSKQPSRPLWLSDPLTQAGEAIFGSTRGNDRIIYRREVMP